MSSPTETVIFVVLLVGLFLAVVVVIPMIAVVGSAVLVRRRFGVPAAAATALVLICGYALSPLPRLAAAGLYFAVPPLRMPLVQADLALSRDARERIVRLATSGSLPPGEYVGEFRLPAGDAGLSVWGTVDVIDDRCGQQVFFMTLTGFSPDPYAGFEHVPRSLTPGAAGTGRPSPWSTAGSGSRPASRARPVGA